MLYLGNDDVKKLLDMKTCLSALEVGYRDLLDGNAVYRPRIDVYMPSDDEEKCYRWGSMEGACRTLGVFAIRMKSDLVWSSDGKTSEKCCIEPGTYCGLIMLFSTRNGAPLAIMNDGIIQHMRVGGCAGLGVKYMARDEPAVVGMLGSGGMARTYLEAFREVRTIDRVKVFSPSKEHRESYAREMTEILKVSVVPVASVEEAVRESDIVATCTDSTVPVVEDPSWIKAGAHLTCVRPNEWNPDTLKRCKVVAILGRHTIDKLDEGMRKYHSTASYAARSLEKTGLLHASKINIFEGRYPTLTDLMAGKVVGRASPSDITFFITAGTQGLQFASVAGEVLRLARERGVGRELKDEWFVQDIRD